jgi:hypothetical protein
MQDFEQLGKLYLGKEYDVESRTTRPGLVLYDSRDLTTHAVCVGMTGSGKTGLCLALLEEAAIDGIPAIVIDPKGDLSNLLLTFPNLAGSDFLQWVDPDEAKRRELSVEQLAEQTADDWRKGLADWGQDPARIARFRDAADVSIYTPGSSAGLPLTVLRSFAVPPNVILENGDALRERIGTAVSGLLVLLGIDADPLRSRDHILLAKIVEKTWLSGHDLSLAELIRSIQTPPFDKIGVMNLDSMFPAKDRFTLSMTLNNLLASPGFSAWMEGEPLDVQKLLYTPAGKPRLSIISIAHLSDAERMFFVTILLNEVIAWMRTQTGTSSLRALLYMDEVFGYFPPTANPPAKIPMLTLLKQARAYGLGVVLATQNPVDLDYKGLSNAGTWFIGRLQTERDKARVLDGLEGASSAAGSAFDRQKMDTLISGLGKRVFLLNNVHEDGPVVFQTRWALSYLRGPLSREQIQGLMARRKDTAKPQAGGGGLSAVAGDTGTRVAATGQTDATQRPILPPDIPEFFMPVRDLVRKQPKTGTSLCYRPALLGTARVRFAQSKTKVDVWETLALLSPLGESLPAAVWDDAQVSKDEQPELEKTPAEGECRFASLPGDLTRPKQFASLTNSLKDYLYRTAELRLWKSPVRSQISRPGESEQEFRLRISQGTREVRDQDLEQARAKYAPKLAALQERIRKAQQKVEKEQSQASQQTLQAGLSFVSSILGALTGRKLASAANVNRAAGSIRAAGRISREKQDVAQATENVEQLQEQYAALESECKAKVDEMRESISPDKLALEEIILKSKKADITVTQVALVWVPSDEL